MLNNKLLKDINMCQTIDELKIFERFVDKYYDAHPYAKIYRSVLEVKKEMLNGKKDKNKIR